MVRLAAYASAYVGVSECWRNWSRIANRSMVIFTVRPSHCSGTAKFVRLAVRHLIPMKWSIHSLMRFVTFFIRAYCHNEISDKAAHTQRNLIWIKTTPWPSTQWQSFWSIPQQWTTRWIQLPNCEKVDAGMRIAVWIRVQMSNGKGFQFSTMPFTFILRLSFIAFEIIKTNGATAFSPIFTFASHAALIKWF